MKRLRANLTRAVWLLLVGGGSCFAQSTLPPARLAIVIETPSLLEAADVLTAELSQRTDLQLLERAQIDKVFAEQMLAAQSKNYLQLGRILGADGLLILSTPLTGQSPTMGMNFGRGKLPEDKTLRLTARLIAVKPGVVLRAMKCTSPNAVEWARGFSQLLAGDIAKLTVAAPDAIPLSLVNLRSAVQSPASLTTERDLKTLALERLSIEPKLFVLERQRLRLLAEEKDFNADGSPFWRGRYLLEGVVDQNGYSPQTVTLNARLNPPRGGAPIAFEVSGSRTNLAEIVNALAAKVMEALKIKGEAADWQGEDEAKKFLAEARWALKWDLTGEAQGAAESAWALGLQTLDCADLRIRSYLAPDFRVAKVGSYTLYQDARQMAAALPPKAPAARQAAHALELYLNFSRTLAPGDIQAKSEWYRLGVDSLVSASRVLQYFYLAPRAQSTAASDLATLRASARATAELMSSWPAIRDTYFVGNRIANRDELIYTIGNGTNLYQCQLMWGAFWQDRPEDTLALYRGLLDSAVFCYLHSDFWARPPDQPRLVAWNATDQQRLPGLWNEFVAELARSTNVLWQMEACALQWSGAKSPAVVQAARDQWLQIVRAHRAELVGNNVELFYLGWGFGMTAEMDALDQEYWRRTIPLRQSASVFPEQKAFLAGFAAYDFQKFVKLFSQRDYTPAQAAELLPLIAAYRSNLLAKASEAQKFQARHNAGWIELFLEKPVQKMAEPTPPPGPAAQPAVAGLPASSRAAPGPPAPTNSSKAPSALAPLLVKKYWGIPLHLLNDTNAVGAVIAARQWSEGKMVLAFSFDATLDTNRTGPRMAAAIFDPQHEKWRVIKYPPPTPGGFSPTQFYPFEAVLKAGGVGRHAQKFELFKTHFYLTDEGVIKQCDLASGAWTTLNLPEHRDAHFSTVAGRLYAANEESIFELLEDGRVSRLLASTRRRPAVTVLDSREELGTPVLYAGPADSLRAWVQGRVLEWQNNDWQDLFPLVSSRPPEVFDEALVGGETLPLDGSTLWFLDRKQSVPELCLFQTNRNAGRIVSNIPRPGGQPVPNPLWKSPPDAALTYAPVAVCNSNLYFLTDAMEVAGGPAARLVCLRRGLSEPIVLPLALDTPGAPKMDSARRSWLWFSDRLLYFGGARVPGMWTVPISEIESAIAQTRKSPVRESQNPPKAAHP